jgi:hypothetical protein
MLVKEILIENHHLGCLYKPRLKNAGISLTICCWAWYYLSAKKPAEKKAGFVS